MTWRWQKRNSNALGIELRLFCIKLTKYEFIQHVWHLFALLLNVSSLKLNISRADFILEARNYLYWQFLFFLNA